MLCNLFAHGETLCDKHICARVEKLRDNNAPCAAGAGAVTLNPNYKLQ